ncbi:Nif11-like leader peptide family natural product precursor [Cyanobacterium sp. Dongsha4]|uniref:Nif11-like leader peptide family natural product precursor n=1 Tax=Cyanobacterium sp. DS4 TaxID=2878255 RepID=UPI002E80FE25|nr:Nif11-like leader peptide family natural product precursor [Cyanobacterium sp. Dongsha4]WVL01348.1 Nif11-like leader peptide family RiPP precursor [Cyanobacterium sp. Dongsha4]
MSIQAVEAFLEQVQTDEELQKDLASALEAENDRQAVTDLANSKNYEFTPDELWAEIQKRQEEAMQRQEAGELTDEELEAVAGGELVVATIVGTVAAFTVSVGGGIAISKIKW